LACGAGGDGAESRSGFVRGERVEKRLPTIGGEPDIEKGLRGPVEQRGVGLADGDAHMGKPVEQRQRLI